MDLSDYNTIEVESKVERNLEREEEIYVDSDYKKNIASGDKKTSADDKD